MWNDRCSTQLSMTRRRAQAGFVYVEYLVILVFVGIVITLALIKVGPSILNDYRSQKTVILEEGP